MSKFAPKELEELSSAELEREFFDLLPDFVGVQPAEIDVERAMQQVQDVSEVFLEMRRRALLARSVPQLARLHTLKVEFEAISRIVGQVFAQREQQKAMERAAQGPQIVVPQGAVDPRADLGVPGMRPRRRG